MEILIAMWLVYEFCRWFGPPLRKLCNGHYRREKEAQIEELRERVKDKKAKKGKKVKRFTITEPDDPDDMTPFDLDGGSLDDEDDLVYPE